MHAVKNDTQVYYFLAWYSKVNTNILVSNIWMAIQELNIWWLDKFSFWIPDVPILTKNMKIAPKWNGIAIYWSNQILMHVMNKAYFIENITELRST